MGTINVSHLPECFGTGVTETGKPQRMDVCDRCTEARRCLIRRMLAIERPHVPAPDLHDRFFPPLLRDRHHV